MAEKTTPGMPLNDTRLIEPITDRSGLCTAKWEMEFARKGRNSLLSFGTADMDFRSPRPVIQAIEQAAHRGHFGYPAKSAGYYEAILGYLQRRFDWRIEQEWLQSATGIYASMAALVLELTRPGDEIIYQTPVHHIFEELIRTNERVPVANPLKLVGGQYEMDLDHLTRAITARTKLLFLCSPHNPVGRVWTRIELTALHELCERRGIVVVSDEVYGGLLFPGVTFTPMASLSRSASLNTITVTSASKPFNTTGLKHSIVIAENERFRAAYLQGMRRTNMQYGGSLFGQVATEAAFRDGDEWSRQLMVLIARNFEATKNFLAEHMPVARMCQPQATYFAWIDCRFMGLSDADLVSFFEDEADIIVSSGQVLGPGGEGHVRLNLGCTQDVLVEGLQRIRRALGRRQQRGTAGG